MGKFFPRILGESWLDRSRLSVRDLQDSAHGGPPGLGRHGMASLHSCAW